METVKKNSKAALWAGWIITGLCVAFNLMDAVMKIAQSKPSVDGSAQIGWPAELLPAVGITLLVCTLLYIIPRTAILGAILITGYLGGAAAIMIRAQMPGHPFFFPIVFGIFVWAGIFFRDEKLRTLIPFRQKD